MDRQIKNKVLVTGSNGFVGTNLCEYLINKDMLINKSYGTSKTGTLDKDEFIIDLKNKRVDWVDSLRGCKSVIHLASRVHIMKENSDNPLEEFRKINYEGTVSLAKQAAQVGVEKFIFLSSIGVNGVETHGQPYSINTPPNPHSPYAVSKFEAEIALKDIAKESGMKLIIIRAPAIYGRNAPGNFRIVEKFIKTGIPLPFLSIKNKRSLISLDNLIDFIYVCLTKAFEENKTFLASDKSDLSTPEILKIMGGINGKKARIFPFPKFLLKLLFNMIGQAKLSQSLLGDLQIEHSDDHTLAGWNPPFKPRSYLKNCD